MYLGFTTLMIDLIRCQKDSAKVVLEDSSGADVAIMEGTLRCTQCGAKYSINDGILDLTSGQRPPDSVSSEEIRVRDSQADTYEERSFSQVVNEMEIPSTLQHLGDLSGKTVIEFGCGTGRLTTRLLETCQQVVALDFSRNSLSILAGKLGAQRNIGLVLADATQVRVAVGKFDVALSTQVLEHIPTRELRAAFLERVNESLVPKGTVICTAYHQHLRRRFRGQRADGVHPSGIFFHRFTLPEIQREIVDQRFEIVKAHPIRIQLPFSQKLHLPVGRLSRKLENVPVLRSFGDLVLVNARSVSPNVTQRAVSA